MDIPTHLAEEIKNGKSIKLPSGSHWTLNKEQKDRGPSYFIQFANSADTIDDIVTIALAEEWNMEEVKTAMLCFNAGQLAFILFELEELHNTTKQK